MSIPILYTKLYVPPPRTKAVLRSDLNERLNEGLRQNPGFEHKLTLISAPAGFGKTTLVSEWVAGCKMPVAWLSLDKGDNDPICFLTYLVVALQTVIPKIGEGILGILQTAQSQPPPIELLLTTLLNELVAISNNIILVLDDYHVIKAQPLNQALTFLIDHLPSYLHLVIATREDPPFPLARWRVRGQLTELRAADLRFTPAEAAEFLTQVMGFNLSAEDIAALENRTEGWIAGLQLAAISMQGLKDISSFIAAFSGTHRYVLDYLSEEVLNRQEPSKYSFLLKTSILDRLTAPLCNAVTGREDSQEMLEQLESANLFIAPLDNKREWYRYHHLFADLLSSHLLRKSPGIAANLHTIASKWFENQGSTGDALHHAFAAQDFERAADIIESVAKSMVADSKMSTLLGWLARLPNGFAGKRPWLAVYGAWANMLTGQFDAVEPLLHSAEARLSEDNHIVASHPVRGNILAIRAFVARFQEGYQHTIELSHEALQYLPESDLIVRSALLANLGITYLKTGDMDSAQQYLQECCTIGNQTESNLYATLTAISYLAEIQINQGNLHKAANIFQKAIHIGNERGWGQPLPATGYACVGLGQLFYEWNDLNKALGYVVEGIKLGEQTKESTIMLKGHLLLARLRQAQGDSKAAGEVIKQAQAIVPKARNNIEEARNVSSWQARVSLMRGDLAEANHWAAEREAKLSLHDLPDYESEMPYLTLVRVHILQGIFEGVQEQLDHLIHKLESGRRMGNVVEILALKSLALQGQGKAAQALSVLESALSLAEPEGYIRTFLDEGESMHGLLREALSRGIQTKYTSKLLAAFGSADSLLPFSTALLEQLSKREIEILRLIKSGMSNREIAQVLTLEESTIKTHINNLYSKLAVQSRTQAIARAAELNLL
jgi:LuxR family transcriptional regulator, maltose regulon positive regulatory protein